MKNLSHTFYITALLTLLVSNAEAREVSLAGMAMRTLERATVFKDKAVGYAGTRPPEVKAFRFLLDQKDSAKAFARVLRNGTLVGQLYALCGLYLTDRAAFDVAVQKYRKMRTRVRTQHGCIADSQMVAEIVAKPKAIRLKPSQTVGGWLQANKGRSAPLDIIGGGYSSWFKDTPAVKFPR